MALLSIFASNPDAVALLNLEQVVATAGDGQLRDNSECSIELRTYFSQVTTTQLAKYVDHCLAKPFNKGGLVLQDLINELGRRLDYEVKDGIYQGVPGGIGYDGLWRSPEGNSIIVEVKTTDVFRMPLEVLSQYRDKLLTANMASPDSSILIVVGRDDTGELEAQIRGSKHAWDMRVISAEALIKLVILKENSDAQETGLKIRSVLVPVEYTRLDRMIDIMFTTATDSEDQSPPLPEEGSSLIANRGNGVVLPRETRFQFTDAALIQATRDQIIRELGKKENVSLIKKTRALYWSAGSHDVRVACSISKRYDTNSGAGYWYAFHPTWYQFLIGGESYFTLGCIDRDEAFVIAVEEIRSRLDQLNTTTKEDGSKYWHIHLASRADGMELVIPNDENFNIQRFAISVDPDAISISVP